jgi:Polysaccharide biosynthesis C-terminal domain
LNRQSLVAVNATVQTIATVVVVFVFTPMGLTAATAAIALRPLVTAAIPIAFAQRHCGIPARSVIRAQALVFCAALLMGLGVCALEWSLANRVVPAVLLAILVAAGIAGYAGLIVLLLPELAAPYLVRLRMRRA